MAGVGGLSDTVMQEGGSNVAFQAQISSSIKACLSTLEEDTEDFYSSTTSSEYQISPADIGPELYQLELSGLWQEQDDLEPHLADNETSCVADPKLVKLKPEDNTDSWQQQPQMIDIGALSPPCHSKPQWFEHRIGEAFRKQQLALNREEHLNANCISADYHHRDRSFEVSLQHDGWGGVKAGAGPMSPALHRYLKTPDRLEEFRVQSSKNSHMSSSFSSSTSPSYF